MVKWNWMALWLIIGVIGLTSPVAADIQADMQVMKNRLANLERGLASIRNGNPSGPAVAGRQLADLQAEIATVRVEFQSLADRVDRMVRDQQQLQGEVKLLRDEMALKDSAIEARLAALEKSPAAALTPATPPAAAVTPVPPSAAANTPSSTVSGTVAPPAATAATDGPQAQYEAALAQIQQDKDFAGGEQGMRTFLKQNPGHSLSVNAMYWIGEALYGQKRYEDSILQLQDVIAQYGDHSKAAAALLKQAIAFDALGDRASAKATLQKLKDRFALSPEADKADQLLAQWN